MTELQSLIQWLGREGRGLWKDISLDSGVSTDKIGRLAGTANPLEHLTDANAHRPLGLLQELRLARACRQYGWRPPVPQAVPIMADYKISAEEMERVPELRKRLMERVARELADELIKQGYISMELLDDVYNDRGVARIGFRMRWTDER